MNQTTEILIHLESKGPITPLEALRDYGCFRLGARIWELRQDGYDIDKEMVSVGNGKRVAEYRLKPKKRVAA